MITTGGQSILDIATQAHGTLDRIVDILVTNPIIDQITDALVPGTLLVIDTASQVKPELVTYLANKQMRVNNRYTIPTVSGNGIGEMVIETDFIIF